MSLGGRGSCRAFIGRARLHQGAKIRAAEESPAALSRYFRLTHQTGGSIARTAAGKSKTEHLAFKSTGLQKHYAFLVVFFLRRAFFFPPFFLVPLAAFFLALRFLATVYSSIKGFWRASPRDTHHRRANTLRQLIATNSAVAFRYIRVQLACESNTP